MISKEFEKKHELTQNDIELVSNLAMIINDNSKKIPSLEIPKIWIKFDAILVKS